MLLITSAPPVIKVFLKVFKNVIIKLRWFCDLTALRRNFKWAIGVQICQSDPSTSISFSIFIPIIVRTVKVRKLAAGCPCKPGCRKGCEKTFFQTQQTRTRRKEKGEKNTLCIFVDSEDNAGKIRRWTHRSLFYLDFVFLSFLLESWVFFLEMLPQFLLSFFSGKEWPGRNACGGVKFSESGGRRGWGAWRSEEEPLELDRAKAINQARTRYLRLCRRLH